MSTMLTIPVSDAALAHLTQRATALGTTPEAVLAADVEQAVAVKPSDTPSEIKPGDLLRQWAGAFDSGVTDLAQRHHYYLGQALAADLRTGGSDEPVR